MLIRCVCVFNPQSNLFPPILDINLIKPTLGRLICGERSDAVRFHCLQYITDVCGHIRMAFLATLNECMLKQLTVFWAITFLFDEAVREIGRINENVSDAESEDQFE